MSKAHSTLQRDRDGKPFAMLPPATGPFDVAANPPTVRAIKMAELPNAPFAIDRMDPAATIAMVNRSLIN